MQIIRPDMWPSVLGAIIILLFLTGLAGFAVLYLGVKNWKIKKVVSFLSIGIGFILLCFVGYNWIGYNRIYSNSESLIIGEFKCSSNDSKLIVLSDKTWLIIGNQGLPCENGSWDYVMSEDLCYWNIKSQNSKCFVQAGSAKTVSFHKQNLIYNRIK